jgi:exodeoxyribonuclease-3
MKLVSWNVNGLRAIVKKGFEEIFSNFDADVFCLQETKLSEGQIDLSFDGYESYWNYADKKGYSGTAIFTRKKPLKVTTGIGLEQHDHEGRVVTLEFDDFYLVDVYTPNAQTELARLSYRMEWERDFMTYVCALDKRKPVVICGDMNVAHNEIDLKNPASNHNNPGFTDKEREAFTRLLEILVVELPLQSPREEHRMAHRLLLGVEPSDETRCRCLNPLRHHRQRPLPSINHPEIRLPAAGSATAAGRAATKAAAAKAAARTTKSATTGNNHYRSVGFWYFIRLFGILAAI